MDNAESEVSGSNLNEYHIQEEDIPYLRIFGAAGIAPIILKKNVAGATATLSRCYAVYCRSKYIIIGLIIACCWGYSQAQFKTSKPNDHMNYIISHIINGVNVFLVYLNIGHCVCYSSSRTRRHLNYINKIKKIHEKFDTNLLSTKIEKRFRILFIISLIEAIILLFIRLWVTLFTEPQEDISNKIYYFLCFYMKNITTLMLELQVIYVIQYVEGMVKALNRKLRSLLKELQHHNYIAQNTWSVKQITDMAEMYICSRDFANQVNASEGSLLFCIVGVVTFNFNTALSKISFVHNDYGQSLNPQYNMLNVGRLWIQILFTFTCIILVIESCYGISCEFTKTQLLLSELLCCPPSSLAPQSLALMRFAAQLDLDPQVFSPMGVLTLNRSFYVSVLGSSVTLLTFLLKFHVKDNPEHRFY